MCYERISLCPSCGFKRHMFWERCVPHANKLSEAMKACVADLPKPKDCPFLEVDDVIPIRPEACPSGFESCGGIRKKKQKEQERMKQEELERQRKDSGIADIEDACEVASIRSSAADSTWDDCAVFEESVPIHRSVPSIVTDGLAINNAMFREYIEPNFRGTRWRPAGVNVTYSTEYVEAGPRELKVNPRNMNQLWAVNISQPNALTRQHQAIGRCTPDIVKPVQSGRQLANPEKSVITEPEIRESNEPDETWLLLKGYHKVPEIREEWAKKKRKNPQPERPVVTVPDAVDEVFRIMQHGPR